MYEIIFATKDLIEVSKNEFEKLLKYLQEEGFSFDTKEKVWHDKTREHMGAYNYIGLLCNKCVVVHIPVKAWHSFKENIQRS